MYPWLSSTLSLLPVIFLFLRSCVSQEAPASSLDSLLPSECPASTNNSWWKPLELTGQDPCELGHQLMQHGAHFGCCSLGSGMSIRRRGRGVGDCDSCGLPTYNIAAACLACLRYPNATTEELTTVIANQSFLPTLQQWDAANNSPIKTIVEPIPLPPWTSVLVANNVFNVEGVVQNASESSLVAGLPEPSAILPSTPASPTGDQMTFIPSNSPASSSTPQANSKTSGNSPARAASIAGGVLGGALALALIALAAIYLMRRRRQMRMPPSAEFMPVVPSARHMVSRDEFPPPFAPGMWSGSVLEKVHTASTTEREFTPGSLSMAHTWDHTSERV